MTVTRARGLGGGAARQGGQGAVGAPPRPRVVRANVRAPGALSLVIGALALAADGCAGAPWFLGEPLDGKPAIPPTSRAETVADHRAAYTRAHAAGQRVLEISELIALEDRGALHPSETKRLIELLRDRARDWLALKRPIPLALDLHHIVALDPGRARALAGLLRGAERGAGDVWLALGESSRAEQAYRTAQRLGADRIDFRLRAAWGAIPVDIDDDGIKRAIADLPERALAPFVSAYLDAGGDSPKLLGRAWHAARVFGPPNLEARLRKLTAGTPGGAAVPAVPAAGDAAAAAGAAIALGVGSAPAPAPVTTVEPAADDRLLEGATLARSLLPLVDTFPDLLAPGPRSREWADRLIAEDPTSPDSFEVAALIDAWAGRIGGASRKLGELVYYSTDRADGYARSARVWERVSQTRRACLAWEHAAHAGAVDDRRWCDLLACVRREPGAGDPDRVGRYVRERAPDLPCVQPDPGAARDATDAGVAADGGAAPAVVTAPAAPIDASPAARDGP